MSTKINLSISNLRSAKDAFVAPVATGMGVALCLMALKRMRPGSKYVIWSRVDQKSCFKAILTAGLEPVIMSLVKHGDELRTDTHSLEDIVNQHGGPDAICAVVTATSVFAPRVADDVPAGKTKRSQIFDVRFVFDLKRIRSKRGPAKPEPESIFDIYSIRVCLMDAAMPYCSL